ncbi:hypothetical protein JQN72_17915 [Phycicoccus sp. CSK15P-2]|uniref:hypothetical protein n=1 Tax=Phycicoccus sp. CSK15P-2 TaxID=2807627 RepID=UPI001950909A|nr:hypothetical protein [Phycicoccus sp. CSK15P-2]MBM6406113.1 hypothetical protein [Phycicoccus sp. CSK15P-2]
MSGVRAAAVLGALLLAGCSIPSTGVTGAGQAPTGVAPGPTLYFLDDDGDLQPRVRETGSLGTVADAVQLLLVGPGGSGSRTGIAETSVTRVVVTTSPERVTLRVPLAPTDVTAAGVDQIVCTAWASHVQHGGSPRATVVIDFTIPTARSARPRTCPLAPEP